VVTVNLRVRDRDGERIHVDSNAVAVAGCSFDEERAAAAEGIKHQPPRFAVRVHQRPGDRRMELGGIPKHVMSEAAVRRGDFEPSVSNPRLKTAR
jgi:hypothetical protein